MNHKFFFNTEAGEIQNFERNISTFRVLKLFVFSWFKKRNLALNFFQSAVSDSFRKRKKEVSL